MNKEEAEQLINKFRKLSIDGTSEFHQHMSLAHIEKIINKFADKPPEKGWTIETENNWVKVDLLPSEEYPTADCRLQIRSKEPYHTEMKYAQLTTTQLKQLRDNINLMLEYLEDDN